jgi:hypothetical protein
MTRRGQKQLTAGDNATPGQLQQMEIEGFMNLIREAAANPAVDPEKLDKLLSLRERVMDRSAEQQFHDAMHRAQERMKFVATDKKNSDKGNRYASFKALDREIRPIYSSEGFSVSYDTGMGKVEYGPIPDGSIRILMDIAHSAGHKIQKHVDIPVETTGAQGTKMMTKIHATGSAMSYGKRYLLIFGFNLAVGEEDDDGNKAGGEKARGGDDHKYKNAQSKSDRKAAKSEPKEGDPDWQPGDRGRQETRNNQARGQGRRQSGALQLEDDGGHTQAVQDTGEAVRQRLRVSAGGGRQAQPERGARLDEGGVRECLGAANRRTSRSGGRGTESGSRAQATGACGASGGPSTTTARKPSGTT